jgi:hypothetical protein
MSKDITQVTNQAEEEINNKSDRGAKIHAISGKVKFVVGVASLTAMPFANYIEKEFGIPASLYISSLITLGFYSALTGIVDAQLANVKRENYRSGRTTLIPDEDPAVVVSSSLQFYKDVKDFFKGKDAHMEH